MSMTCNSSECKRHPEHAPRSFGSARDVKCWARGDEGEFVTAEHSYVASYLKADVNRGKALVEVFCANYEQCTGCPVCQPLPKWALESCHE